VDIIKKIIVFSVLILFLPLTHAEDIQRDGFIRGVVNDYIIASKIVVIGQKRYRITPETETGELRSIPVEEWIERDDLTLNSGDPILFRVDIQDRSKLNAIYRILE